MPIISDIKPNGVNKGAIGKSKKKTPRHSFELSIMSQK
jgi:hypothetical protein